MQTALQPMSWIFFREMVWHYFLSIIHLKWNFLWHGSLMEQPCFYSLEFYHEGSSSQREQSCSDNHWGKWLHLLPLCLVFWQVSTGNPVQVARQKEEPLQPKGANQSGAHRVAVEPRDVESGAEMLAEMKCLHEKMLAVLVVKQTPEWMSWWYNCVRHGSQMRN